MKPTQAIKPTKVPNGVGGSSSSDPDTENEGSATCSTLSSSGHHVKVHTVFRYIDFSMGPPYREPPEGFEVRYYYFRCCILEIERMSDK